MSQVSEPALFVSAPHSSYLSAAGWKSSSLPHRAGARAVVCRMAQTGGSGESHTPVALAAGVRGLWHVPRTCLARLQPLRGGPLCHPGSVMSPDVPLGLGCSSSDLVWKGRERLLLVVPGLVPHPRGKFGQVGEGLGRWCRAGRCPALGQPLCAWGGEVGTSRKLMWEVQGPGKSVGRAFFFQARVTASARVLS